MPRGKRTQPAQTPSMEAGASYGEVSDNLIAQNPNEGGIPLPQTRESGQAPAPASVPTPGPLPVEQAQGFTPNITPLLAPGQNRPSPRMMQPLTVQQRTAEMLQNWAVATGDPLIAEAAAQLRSP